MRTTRTPVQRYLPSALLAVGVLLVLSTRSQTSVPLGAALTTVLPTWQGLRITDQKISDEEKRIAGMTEYVARVYWRDTLDAAFTTYVGYYDRQSQGHSMHSPKNCLPGAGWEILKTDLATVRSGGRDVVVNKFLLKNGAREAFVYYWYQGRGRIVASEYAVKWNLLHDAALVGHTEEALVRIVAYVPRASTLPAGTTLGQAYAAAERLGAEVAGHVLTDVARVLPPAPGQSARAAGDALQVAQITAFRRR